MLLFAHLGLTLAAAKGAEKMLKYRGRPDLARKIDYRAVLVGSMLPDIIDKPLGGIVLRETLGNGRIYSHTLVFLLLILGMGALLRRKAGRHLLTATGGGVAVHHLLDGMWNSPATFFWPFFGAGFPRGDAGAWLQLWLHNLQSDPFVYVPEAAGGIVLLYFLLRKNVLFFPKSVGRGE